MNWLVDGVLIGALIFSGYTGAQRGLALMSLELGSFALATLAALVAYHPAGNLIKSLTGASASLANVAAFAVIWVVVEIAVAITIRFTLLRHLNRAVQLSRLNQIGGAVLGALKTLIVITLGLVIFAGLPLSATAKRPVTDSLLGGHLLASSGRLQTSLAGGLGHDLGESLNFFTVTAEPESEQRIDLGYTTTAVTADPQDEAAMLVLLNQERTSRGLGALTPNDKARTVARAYSTDMFARGYFSHINPEGKNPFDRMRAGGVEFSAAGENLALAPTLQLAHQGLMNSPGHRANILSKDYRTVGIGIIDGGPYGLMVTQDFTD
jgi:uncharacterized protein YkwD/uncharacterized membrane protein required for colicin V production